MKKRQLLIVLTMLLALLLTGCGAAATEQGAYDRFKEDTVVTESVEYAVEEEAEMIFTSDSAAAVEEPQATPPVDGQGAEEYAEKIVYSGHVYVETTDFDGSIQALNAAVTKYGGFIQDSDVSGRSNGDRTAVVDRYAYYVVRIPTQHFDTFMTLTGDIGNVTSSGRSAQNVTSQYTDYEARLTSLYTQEERLLAMLGSSGDLESLIALEQRLSEVRYEIESIERSLRDLDQRLAYSTVNIDLQEVEVYTDTAPVQRSFGQKLSDALSDGWDGFVDGCESLLLALASVLPVLIVLLVFILAGVIVLVKLIKKWLPKQEKKPEKEENSKN